MNLAESVNRRIRNLVFNLNYKILTSLRSSELLNLLISLKVLSIYKKLARTKNLVLEDKRCFVSIWFYMSKMFSIGTKIKFNNPIKISLILIIIKSYYIFLVTMETKITFLLNEEIIEENLNPSVVLLDFLRKDKHLTGTKEVCKEGDCGACAVLLGELTDSGISYKVINSCLYPIQKVNGKHVVTIEGLNQETLSPVQESFMDEGASQCGFCTPGFIISATGYLINTESYNYDKVINSVAGNICRCTGYNSIKKSLKRLENINNIDSIKTLIDEKVLPEYFLDVELKLKSIRVKKEKVKSNSNVQFISGGTDLFVQKPDIILESDVKFIHEEVPRRIELKDNSIIISGSATIDMLNSFFTSKIKSKQFDKLFKMFASLPIRNSATIAGNIVNASPIADLTISLLALNAKLELRNSKGEKRFLLLKDFYKGYKTLDKKNDEIIENIIIPKLD